MSCLLWKCKPGLGLWSQKEQYVSVRVCVCVCSLIFKYALKLWSPLHFLMGVQGAMRAIWCLQCQAQPHFDISDAVQYGVYLKWACMLCHFILWCIRITLHAVCHSVSRAGSTWMKENNVLFIASFIFAKLFKRSLLFVQVSVQWDQV